MGDLAAPDSANMAGEPTDAVEQVDGEYQYDENLDDDGDWSRKAGDALDAPEEEPDDYQQDDEDDEEIYAHRAICGMAYKDQMRKSVQTSRKYEWGSMAKHGTFPIDQSGGFGMR